MGIMKMQVKVLSATAKVPTYAHVGDAGMDLFADEAVTIPQGTRAQIKTGVAFAIPEGYVGLIWDKSGISHKGGLKTLGGVVDAGYRGEVLVGLINLSDTPYEIEKGVKIAQMLIQRVERLDIECVETLDDTTRGAQGFGSTGI